MHKRHFYKRLALIPKCHRIIPTSSCIMASLYSHSFHLVDRTLRPYSTSITELLAPRQDPVSQLGYDEHNFEHLVHMSRDMDPSMLRGALLKAVEMNDMETAFALLDACKTSNKGFLDEWNEDELQKLTLGTFNYYEHYLSDKASEVMNYLADYYYDKACQGYALSDTLIRLVMEMFTSLNKTSKAMHIFQKYQSQPKKRVNSDIYKQALRILYDQGSFVAVQELFQELLKIQHVKLDAELCLLMINTFAAIKDMDKAVQVFNFMVHDKGISVERDVIHGLLHACKASYPAGTQFKPGHSPEDLIKVMHKHDIMPNTTTYAIIISMLLNRKEKAEALEIFKYITSNEKLIATVTSTESIYNALVHIFASSGDANATNVMINSMKELDLKPNSSTYNTLLTCYRTNNNYAECLRVLKWMKDNNIPIETKHYDNVLGCFLKGNNIAGMLAAYENFIAEGMIPDKATFNMLFKVGYKKNAFKIMKKFFTAMRQEYQIAPDIKLYKNVLTAYRRCIFNLDKKQTSQGDQPKKDTSAMALRYLAEATEYYQDYLQVHLRPSAEEANSMLGMRLVCDRLVSMSATQEDLLKQAMEHYKATFDRVVPDENTLKMMLDFHTRIASRPQRSIAVHRRNRSEKTLIMTVYKKLAQADVKISPQMHQKTLERVKTLDQV